MQVLVKANWPVYQAALNFDFGDSGADNLLAAFEGSYLFCANMRQPNKLSWSLYRSRSNFLLILILNDFFLFASL